MPLSQESITKVASGTVAINQASGTDIAVITDPGPGRYKVWGTCRHTLADGCRLLLAATTIIANIPSQATAVASYGPVVLDVVNRTDDIILELATATGAADTASGVIYAQRLDA